MRPEQINHQNMCQKYVCANDRHVETLLFYVYISTVLMVWICLDTKPKFRKVPCWGLSGLLKTTSGNCPRLLSHGFIVRQISAKGHRSDSITGLLQWGHDLCALGTGSTNWENGATLDIIHSQKIAVHQFSRIRLVDIRSWDLYLTCLIFLFLTLYLQWTSGWECRSVKQVSTVVAIHIFRPCTDWSQIQLLL